MKYVKIILNFLIKLIFFFLFFATWISLYSKNVIFNLCLAGALTLIALLIWHLISKIHLTKQNLKQVEKKQIEIMVENLRCMPTKTQKKFIQKIYNNNLNSNIYVNLNSKCLNENEFYLIMQNAQKNKKNSIKVFCINANTALCLKCENQETVNIEFFDKYDIYKMCKQKNIFPQEIIKQKNKTKITLKVLLSNLLNKKRAKQYFAFSAFLLIFSLFTLFKTYYIISSTIFLFLGLISLFENTLKQKQVSQQN